MSKQPKAEIVGNGPDGEPIVSGHFIFWLMDSKGLPLEIQVEILKEKGWGFSVLEFIEAAILSKNWSPVKLENKLVQAHGDEEIRGLIRNAIRHESANLRRAMA